MRRRLILDVSRGSGLVLVAMGVLMVVSTIGTALAVRLSGAAIDEFLADPASSAAMALIVAALVSGAVGAGTWSLSDVCTARYATSLAVRLRARMVRHTLGLPMGFFTERSVGEITDRISTDVDTVAGGIIGQAKPIAMGVLGAAVAVVLSATVAWPLALLFLPATIGIVITSARAGRRVAAGSRALQAQWAEAAGTAEEAFGARDDLRQVLGRGFVMRKWAEHGATLWAHRTRLGRDQNILTLSTMGLLRAFQFVVLVGGSVFAVRGQLGAGDVWAAFGLVRLFSSRVEEVLLNIVKVSEVVAATQRIDELLAEPTEPLTTIPARPVDWDGAVGIRVAGLRFAYGDGPEVLHDVSVSVPPGRSLAIIGRTGSGKSTIVRLLNRTMTPDPDQVFIGGVDVCAIDRRDLRAHVGVVSQRVELLRASVRDNVTLFDRSIDDGRVLDAFETLGLTHWLADLPAGLDTRLGDHQTMLSSGEEQLVAFARLLVRDPAVVVLDEATARLDPGTELLLQRATERLLAGRTSIIVAHRLATIAGVDDVLVLADGRVVEHGRRADLLARPGSTFARLTEQAGGLDVQEVVAHREQRPLGRRRRAAAMAPAGGDTVEAVDHDQVAPSHTPSVVATTARLLRRHAWVFVPGLVGWLLFFTTPAVTAWVWSSLLPRLTPGGAVAVPLLVFFVASALGLVGRLIGDRMYTRWWLLNNITLRSNLIAAQLHPDDRHAGARPASPGDAVSRVWDTNDLVNYADHVVDLAGSLTFLVVVTVLSGQLSTAPWLAAVAVVPFVVAWSVRHRIGHVAAEHARVKGIWTGRVAEVCGAATTVKGFAAEEHVEAHLADLTEQRQSLAYRQRRLEVGIIAPVFLTSDAAQRLVLLLAIASGVTARAADAVALAEAISLMPIAGIVVCMLVEEAPLVRSRLRRMARLIPSQDPFDLTRPPTDLQLPPAMPMPVPTPRPPRVALDRLALDRVTVVYDDGTEAIADISFEITRGQLVVITGPIASGKSTLLRVLAGLCPPTHGTLRWDDVVLDDPSTFLRPPNCSFVHQAPAIVSGTVADNVALDHDLDVDAALRLAELERDLGPVGGRSAVVGHRGLRLSGGQTQRLATARATASGSELLVLDDLSSALDVETEQNLWRNLRETGHTVVATSYKRAALERADQIIVLHGGRVAAIGRLIEVDGEFGHLFA
jgi:ABC-type multidrug transport system fused ATPase/permease subunit